MRISDWSSDVCSSDLAAVAGMKAMRNLGGLCVTVPHKIELAALCDDLGASGRRIGAVNAVRFDDVPDAGPGGARRMVGDNFDGQGYVAGMRSEERRGGKECGSTCRSRWWRCP